MKRSANPSMNAPSASEEASVSEPLLSWGSSVNVNEDLRRSIRTEIENIDANIDTLQSHIKNEDRTSAQLAKDFAHARAEMVQLRRSAADELDNATIKEQVRNRLKASLRSELMSPTSVVSSDPMLESTNDPSREGETTKAPTTTSAYLEQRAAEVKELAGSIAREKESLMKSKAEKDELERQTQVILDRIKKDKLVEELEAAKKETAFRAEELEKEERRKRSTKEAVQKVRTQCGHHAQQIADQVSTVSFVVSRVFIPFNIANVLSSLQTRMLTSKKTKNEDQEAELDLRLKHMEEQLRSDDSNAKLEAKYTSLSEQLAQLNQQLEDFEAIRAERKAVAAEREATKQETEQLVKSKSEFQVKLDDARTKYASSMILLEEAKAVQASVEAERVANDKVHAEQIVPGQAEKNALMEEKENLAKSINKLHEESVANDKENSKGLVTQSETLNKLDLGLKLVKGELTEKLASIESIKKAREQADEATQKELKEHQDFRTKFEEATATETARIAELESERKRERQERCEEARDGSSKMRAELETKLEILRAGAELISTTKELENQ